MSVAEYVAEPVPGLDHACDHGEGPFCDPRTGEVLWVDGTAAALHRFDPALGASSLETVTVGITVAAFARPHDGGGYVVVADNAIWQLPAFGEGMVHLADIPEGPDVWVNEGAVDPLGRLWAGTMSWTARPAAGSLWVWPGNGEPTRVLDGVTVSNGLDWSPAAEVAYYVDSAEQTIDTVRFDEGAVAGGTPSVAQRQTVVSIDPSSGVPDGLIVDDDGCIWVALWGGSSVHRYSPSGELLARVRVPAPQPSAVCFAGAGRDVLYITSSRDGLSAAELDAHPDSGRLFAVRVAGVSGGPANVFRSQVTGAENLPLQDVG